MDFDGTHWEMEALRYFLIGEFIEVAQFDNATVRRFELSDDVAEHLGTLCVDDFLFGVRHIGRERELVEIVLRRGEVGKRDHIHTFVADMVDALVGGDGEEPGAERMGRGIEVERAESLAEGFQRKVVGLIGVVSHLENHKIEGLSVETHEVGKSMFIALLASGTHEFVVAHSLIGLKIYEG